MLINAVFEAHTAGACAVFGGCNLGVKIISILIKILPRFTNTFNIRPWEGIAIGIMALIYMKHLETFPLDLNIPA